MNETDMTQSHLDGIARFCSYSMGGELMKIFSIPTVIVMAYGRVYSSSNDRVLHMIIIYIFFFQKLLSDSTYNRLTSDKFVDRLLCEVEIVSI